MKACTEHADSELSHKFGNVRPWTIAEGGRRKRGENLGLGGLWYHAVEVFLGLLPPMDEVEGWLYFQVLLGL